MIFLLALLVIAYCISHMSMPQPPIKDFVLLLILVLVIVVVFLNMHGGALVN